MTTDTTDTVYYINSVSAANGKVTHSVFELPREDAKKLTQLDSRLGSLQMQSEDAGSDADRICQARKAEAVLIRMARRTILSGGAGVLTPTVQIVTNGEAFKPRQVLEKSMVHLLRSSRARVRK